jgi:hypothetical protein
MKTGDLVIVYAIETKYRGKTGFVLNPPFQNGQFGMYVCCLVDGRRVNFPTSCLKVINETRRSHLFPQV